MKLAEALLLRADLQKKLASLKARIDRNIQVQENETPDENSQELMIDAQQVNDQLHDLIAKIHRTNAHTMIGNHTLMTVLVERDKLVERHKIVMSALNAARRNNDRYSNREIKWVVTIPVKALQKQADDISEKIRTINNTIQANNWQIELME
ncbi:MULTISPECIES: DIP1984 family protein [unclassified Acinetobacter]|uniref:DIP1984 family protein n=1 Tax=unclassified Acinetobacter TaxID=196816 RepID=UPI0035B84D70